MLLLSMSAFGIGNGNVQVEVENVVTTDLLYYDMAHTLNQYWGNDDLLGGASANIELVYSVPLTFEGGDNPVIGQVNRAVGGGPGGSCWTMTGLQVNNDTPIGDGSDWLSLGGAAMPGFGYAAGPDELAYTWNFDVGAGSGLVTDALCISAIAASAQLTWTFTDGGGGYAPNFQGQPTGSEVNPQAPAVCFDADEVPCLPPVWTATPPAMVMKNHCMDYTFQLAATEGGNTPPADPVTYGGDYTAANGFINRTAPGTCFTEDVSVYAQNACMGMATYDFQIQWTNNLPSINNCPVLTGKIAKGNAWLYDFNVTDNDVCDNHVWSVTHVGTAPTGLYDINNLGEFEFNTVDADGGNTYDFQVTVEDDCGAQDVCDFSVEVLATEPFIIRIEKTHMTFQGHYEYVMITKEAGSELMGGFDFLLCYDASALSFMSAQLGADLGPGGDGWEFFTYRYGAWGNCDGPCPSGKLRVVAMADQNNGPNHPTGYGETAGDLVELKFYVTNDRTYECQYVPIRFCWADCGDNGISSIEGDTLFISDQVYDYEWDGDLGNPDFNITGIDCDEGWGFNYGGACEWCDVSDKYAPVRFIYFWNGGIDIACADSIDRKGDLNLNGIENEIADAVLYTNYFLQGIIVFDNLEAQTAASDVNNDGMPLTVGDLVYLIRIITGDALPFPKLAPFANAAEINVVNGMVTT
jgi:hypothetical protein